MGMEQLKGWAMAIGVLAVVTLMTLAVITQFKNTDLVDNTTADNFVTGLTYFGTFSAILVIAAIGFVVIKMFMSSKGSGGL